ncbi:MAG: hypothetical protein A07HR60_01029 [uncultured archaeon A07HR60]|jgi:Uncharacterized conserved protein|nr:MAG: hypothetical protein J07HR59_00416 [Halorubrum sp. J07HR59]ESS12090.1 MAG: hypothetical protein A07HR60_01029 [uncultured archaeon A07HR60]
MPTWKRDFASGLVVIVPLVILLVVVNWLYVHLTGIPLIGQLEPGGLPEPVLPFYRAFIALAVLTTVVFGVGYFMRTALGRVAESKLDDSINRIPALRVVYNASKLAVETALSGTDDLQSPVYLETWPGIRMTAFKTGKHTRDGKVVLFMPTAPNITSGFVIEVEPERATETGEAVEEALTRILSAGFAESAHNIPVEEQQVDIGDVTGPDAPQTDTPTGQTDMTGDPATGPADGTPGTDGGEPSSDGGRPQGEQSRWTGRRF